VGVALGQGDVRSDAPVSSSTLHFDEHHSAWKVLGGIHPIPLFSAELEYIDFGHPSASGGTTDVRQHALAAMALLALPLPVPFLDVYGKAGLARLSTTFNARQAFAFSSDRTDNDFAFGAGVAVHVASVSVRGEYERISAGGGNPDLLSLGVNWSF
jgi:opacity protein-like surface antigen